MMQIYETTYEAGRYRDGKRDPNFQQFATRASATTWAAMVPRDFSGLAIEEQRWLRDESNGGQRTRVWCGSAYSPRPGMGKPMESRPRALFSDGANGTPSARDSLKADDGQFQARAFSFSRRANSLKTAVLTSSTAVSPLSRNARIGKPFAGQNLLRFCNS
jgi:hypothetical protein